MKQVGELATTLLTHAKVRQAWESARARWPSVELALEPLVTHLAERLPETISPGALEPLLAQLSLEELYLACACLRGLAPAIAIFESEYLAKLPGRLRGSKYSEAMIDDVCQLARVKLLVHTPEGAPKISEYVGQGALMSWVQVIAVRIAVRLQAAEKPASEEDTDLVLAALPAPGVDAEMDLIKRRHHADFRLAVREAFAGLSADERHLFRLYYADKLSTYELAALFRVNQSTVSRWLESARQRVYEETQRCLQARLGMSARDFKSFLAAIKSQLDLGLSQLLRDEEDEKDGEDEKKKKG